MNDEAPERIWIDWSEREFHLKPLAGYVEYRRVDPPAAPTNPVLAALTKACPVCNGPFDACDCSPLVVTRNGIPCEDQVAALEEFKQACAPAAPDERDDERVRRLLWECEQRTGMSLGSASSPNDLVDRIKAFAATVRAEEREAAFKDAIKWAEKVHTVKINAARDAQTDDEFSAMRLGHEADGAARVVETLNAALESARTGKCGRVNG